MDDWEQFFSEKSRRRADKQREEERARLRQLLFAVALFALVLFGAIALLAMR